MGTTRLSAKPTPSLAPVTWTLFLTLAAYGLALFGVGPSLIALSRDYRVPLGRTGTLFTAFFIGFMMGVMAAGYLAERWGKKRVLAFGLGVLAAGLLLFGLAPGLGRFELALAAIWLFGCGGALMETSSSALVTDVNPERAAFALNLSQAFFGIGAIAGPGLVGYMLSHGISWRVHFYLSAAVVAAILVALLPQKAKDLPSEPATWARLGAIVRRPVFLLSAVSMALYIGAEIGYSGWISAFLERTLQARPDVASQGVAAYWLGMTAGRFISGWAAERLGSERLVVVLATIAGLACLATAYAGTPTMGLALAALGGVGMSGIFASILTTASSHFPGVTATVFAMVMVCVGVGGMSFPAAMGALADGYGLRLAMVVPALLLATLGTVMVALHRLRPGGGGAPDR